MQEGTRVILQVRWGPLAFRKAVIEPGRSVRVGRGERADLVVARDTEISAVHFEVSWDGTTCVLRDLDSARGTHVEGEPKATAELRHGSWIRAGDTIFCVFFEGLTIPLDAPETPDPPGAVERRRAALAALRDEPAQLYAVLDAARDDRVLELLRVSPNVCSSLYSGAQGDALEDVAPYLVALPKASWLLDRLAIEGWGKSWGIYLANDRSFKEVRDHLRRYLMVAREQTGAAMYFRFYDPRVLRVFLPTCTPRESAQFFGETRRFLLEGEEGEVVRFASRIAQGDVRP